DPGAWPLGRLVPEQVGRAFAAKLGAAGVSLRLGTTAQSVERRADGGLRVRLADGGTIDTDAVLSAIGLRPRTQLAQAAGLAVNRGVVVDRQLRASAPDVYALGDCAEVAGQVLPFVMPLMNAARALAKT